MNELPRQKLREIVARHGPSIVNDARRCEGLLRDHAGQYRREVSVLVSALEERVPAEMLAAPAATPREILLARMSRRLCDHLALSEPAARWAVNSWALALGLIDEDELKTIEQRSASPAEAGVGPDGEPTAEAERLTTSGAASLVVSADGGGDYASITEALRHAPPGARVVVRPGVYDEGITLDKQVEIVGEGPREQVVIRSIAGSCLHMQTDRARVAGLTFRGAAADGAAFFAVDIPRGRLLLEDCDISSDTLSCVAVRGADAAPVLRRCLIHDGADSGLYFFEGASGQVEDCEVYRNANVGVAVGGGAAPTISRSRIHGGANAGVVFWQGASGLVEGCEIYGNRGACLGVSDGATPTARACRIYGGENSGVFVHRRGEAVLEDCELFGHREAEAAVTTRGKLFLNGCRVHRGQDSGVYVREGGQALLQGCAVSGNAGAGVSVGAGSVLAVLACEIKDNARFAFEISAGATARVEDSDLTGNRLGPWSVEDGAAVEAERNRDE
jgi:hypothetical protein